MAAEPHARDWLGRQLQSLQVSTAQGPERAQRRGRQHAAEEHRLETAVPQGQHQPLRAAPETPQQRVTRRPRQLLAQAGAQSHE